MKFGLMYNTGFCRTDPDLMIAAARHAEQCGFEPVYPPVQLPQAAFAARLALG
jgi:hypothetical protein